MTGANFTPLYSHGGTGAPGWPPVSGTATGAGLPIDVHGAIQSCAMFVYVTGGIATVTIEASAGQLDTSGNPPDASWVDQSDTGAGYDLTTSAPIAKIIPATLFPFWRTKILSIGVGATVASGIGPLIVSSPSGHPQVAGAKYPLLTNYATIGM